MLAIYYELFLNQTLAGNHLCQFDSSEQYIVLVDLSEYYEVVQRLDLSQNYLGFRFHGQVTEYLETPVLFFFF